MRPLKQPLPPGRTLEQVWHHYEVEAELASRLKCADKEGRKAILATMYGELFAKVPDHPRLTRRSDTALTADTNRVKETLFAPFMRPDAVAVEFAPGDCEFAATIAPRVKKLFGIDICDQRTPGRQWPRNFELVVYDGDTVSQIAPASVDVIISDQLLEHLHPEDAVSHLQLVHSLLRRRGCYVIRTPHAIAGPWDVSRYFSDVPEGFHLKEWTYSELGDELRRVGYRRIHALWTKKGVVLKVPLWIYLGAERLLSKLPRDAARRISHYLMPMVGCVAYK